MRWLTPGQIAWDYAVTNFENGNYWQGAANTGIMFGEIVFSVATAGEYQAAKSATQCTTKGLSAEMEQLLKAAEQTKNLKKELDHLKKIERELR